MADAANRPLRNRRLVGEAPSDSWDQTRGMGCWSHVHERKESKLKLEPEQIQDLPWAALDDLLDAIEDVAAYGRCWAEIVNVDGDVRLRRVKPGSDNFLLRTGRIHVP